LVASKNGRPFARLFRWVGGDVFISACRADFYWTHRNETRTVKAKKKWKTIKSKESLTISFRRTMNEESK